MKLRNLISTILLLLAAVGVCSADARGGVVRIGGFELSVSPRDAASESNVRDFSESDKISQAGLKYFTRGDSVVMELLPVLRSDYLISSDSVWLTTMEGSSWKFNVDSLSMNQSVARVRGLASSNLSRKFYLDGVCLRELAQNQTVILEPGDTIRNAKYLEHTIDCSSVEPSIAEAQTQRVKVTRRYWFAENSIYPIAVELDINAPWVENQQYTYIFPLYKHPVRSIMNDEPEQISPKSLYNVQNSGFADYDSRMSYGELPFEFNSIEIDTYDGNVEIHLPNEEEVDVILCDVAGRVLESQFGVRLQTSFSNLTDGAYLISISGRNWRVTQKITTR